MAKEMRADGNEAAMSVSKPLNPAAVKVSSINHILRALTPSAADALLEFNGGGSGGSSYTPIHSLSKLGLRGKKFTYRGALIVFCAKSLKLSNMFFSTAGTLSFSGTSSSELLKKTCL